jgi:hypothetical protein
MATRKKTRQYDGHNKKTTENTMAPRKGTDNVMATKTNNRQHNDHKKKNRRRTY